MIEDENENEDEDDLKVSPALWVRMYGEGLGDFQVVNSWWEARHHAPLPEVLLPPLGVVVELHGEPVAALWCYECFGIGVCFLEHPVTRPGLGLAEARRCLGLAVEACVRVAKSHGDFSFFKGYTTPVIARMLPGLGFRRCGAEVEAWVLRRDGE